MNSIASRLGRKRILRFALLGLTLLALGLSLMILRSNLGHKRTIRSSSSGSAKRTLDSTKLASGSTIIKGDGVVKILGAGGERIIPAASLSISQARSDSVVRFLTPQQLPVGAKLQLVFRVPNSEQTISQRYDINGKYLEIWAEPLAEAPNYRRIANEGTVKTPEQNPDGSIKTNADGTVNWVRRDNTIFIKVNGYAGIASEPTQVKAGPAANASNGGIIDNPGTLTWWANGTQYSIWGLDISVSELLKIAESMN